MIKNRPAKIQGEDVLTTMVIVAVLGCANYATAQAKIVLAFVDLAASVKDFEGYREAWQKIVDHLNGDDRIVLGRINDETFTRFRAMVDETIPAFHFLTDNKLRYEKTLKEAKDKIATKFAETIAGPKSKKTDILNSLLIAEKIFRAEKRRPVLILLSDMLEDSGHYNFERIKVNDTFTRQLIEAKRKSKQLADLLGAKVYVAGASANNADKALEVQQFWLAFFKAANGNLAKENYGPALISFNE